MQGGILILPGKIGMLLMTNALGRLASRQTRAALGRLTTSPATDAVAGAATTADIQSSSATMLMTIGYVGAGPPTFPQAVGVLFGANVGTTVTGWMVVLLGFKLTLATAALPILFASGRLSALGRGRWARFVTMLAGFSLVFLGLDRSQTGTAGFQDIIIPETPPADSVGGGSDSCCSASQSRRHPVPERGRRGDPRPFEFGRDHTDAGRGKGDRHEYRHDVQVGPSHARRHARHAADRCRAGRVPHPLQHDRCAHHAASGDAFRPADRAAHPRRGRAAALDDLGPHMAANPDDIGDFPTQIRIPEGQSATLIRRAALLHRLWYRARQEERLAVLKRDPGLRRPAEVFSAALRFAAKSPDSPTHHARMGRISRLIVVAEAPPPEQAA
ncbi:hypothetical protein DEA8626_03514 [Defluviimonas aquaemixtae]|uniref:Uncharacterized protein n=1 Tax=Albidovulum aquaemixtae TaxID=1542388 RepID=A0A2R8BM20_9RHOB|nr:Na/Pi symporter [Defluviimonas aquaemixtae]SPH24462.1 hypothetical protein DEA8626_03514 [Defluviimonas aquaemixtae]